jgi:hypothetical protein
MAVLDLFFVDLNFIQSMSTAARKHRILPIRASSSLESIDRKIDSEPRWRRRINRGGDADPERQLPSGDQAAVPAPGIAWAWSRA